MSQYDINRDAGYFARDEARIQARRETNNNAVGWLVAGAVAVIAIIAVAFMVTNNNNGPTAQDLQTAADNARTQGIVEGSNAALSSVQSSAQSAAASAQAAADQAAADTRAAAAQARDAADRAASSAQDTVTPASPPEEKPAPQQ